MTRARRRCRSCCPASPTRAISGGLPRVRRLRLLPASPPVDARERAARARRGRADRRARSRLRDADVRRPRAAHARLSSTPPSAGFARTYATLRTSDVGVRPRTQRALDSGFEKPHNRNRCQGWCTTWRGSAHEHGARGVVAGAGNPERRLQLAAGLHVHLLRGADVRAVAHPEGDAADQAAAHQAGLQAAVSFDDIAGVDEAKAELRRSSSSCAIRGRSTGWARRCRRASCCTARPAPARRCSRRRSPHESGAEFFAQSAASFVEMFAGLGAARIRRLFAIARKHEPAIIFIDELDAVGGRRGTDISGEKDQTLNQLLVEMDGFDTNGRVVVIAASNLLEKLDPRCCAPAASTARCSSCRPTSRGARRRAAGAHALEADGRRRPRADRPADQRPDGRRPRQHLQRGGDLRRSAPGARRSARRPTSTPRSSA